MPHEADERRPEAGNVEQGERLGVIAKRVPRPRFEHLVERADAAGQADEGVAQLGHLGLALMHVGDRMELGQAGVRDFLIDQRLRDDAVNLAAGISITVSAMMPIRPSRPPP